jgi:branched-chain amino acid transport system permease protein
MELFEVSVIFGITLGITYAVTGAGLVIIFRESGIINFAHGDIATAGLFVGYFAYTRHAPYWIVALTVIVSCGLLGGAIALGLVGPISRRRSHLDVALLTIAISLIIQGIETYYEGGGDRSFPSIGTSAVFSIGSVQISQAQLLALASGVVLFGLIAIFFRTTNIGVAMRAISDNPQAAALMGIPLRRIRWLSWTLGSLCAGVAGLFVAPLYALNVTSVDILVIYGFIVIALGGFDSTLGALIAGLAVGIGGNMISAYLGSDFETPILVLVMLLVLIRRPYGLLGRAPIERV